MSIDDDQFMKVVTAVRDLAILINKIAERLADVERALKAHMEMEN